MSALHYNKSNTAWIDGVSITELAQQFPTPFYVYSRKAYQDSVKAFLNAFRNYPSLICYALKANSNLSIIKDIFGLGLGADIVSLGELKRAQLAGCEGSRIVFSGVGKRNDEIAEALKQEILLFNVESLSEIQQLNTIAKGLNKKARISLRINPNIDAKTNPYIATGLYKTKFGLPEYQLTEALSILGECSHLTLSGLSMHLGSQITSKKPFSDGAKRIALIATKLLKERIPLEFLNVGGGLGIDYEGKSTLDIRSYAKTIIDAVRSTSLKLILEPGRAVIGTSGCLVTTVLHVKKNSQKTFVIVDAGMNDLIRPSLYSAYHEVKTSPRRSKTFTVDVVGPICETGDFFALKRTIPIVAQGDLILVMNAGAYGMSMVSHYNSRPNLPEILIDSDSYRLIRRAEPLDALWENELSSL